ncbi:PREDICTED: fibulin-5-like [Nicrophorus vespilloides]|uniref:Fibulin-5-like n=1 Tax=Nicrophorus vespilloides TaxID=110193 RepID=A0ABM1NJI1_NICVS|nr:PREDICTED: fibulin-5-like [Nicrophorus vespilloides]
MRSVLLLLCFGFIHAQNDGQTVTPTAVTDPTIQTPTTTDSTIAPSTICSVNETLSVGGYDCSTCQNPRSSCAFQTETKCYCKVGFIRDSSKRCIRPQDCSSLNACSLNETYSDAGYSCHNCDNYKTEICNLDRRTSCYCNPGFVRNVGDNLCIGIEDCVIYEGTNCRPNSTYSEIGYDCMTCDNRQNHHCPLSRVAKCYCNPGYIRVFGSERCVKSEDCNVLQQNVSDMCKNRWTRNCRGCFRTCTYNKRNRNHCPEVCRRCDCPNGQVRDTETGRCIHRAEQCGKNEVFISWGSACYSNERSCIPPMPVKAMSPIRSLCSIFLLTLEMTYF